MMDWAETTLGEAYDVRDGTHDSPKYQSEGFPLITSKNLKSAGLNFEKVKYISQADYDAINKRSAVHKGDVLFAMIGTIGNPIVVETDPRFAIKNVALFKVPHSQDGYFLKHYLSSNFVKDKMSREAKGTTQKFVGLGYLRKFPINLPPLPEQKRIVAILDEAFAGIDAAVANTEKNLANARELFESYLNAVFTQKGDGWVEKTLGEVCHKIQDGAHHSPKKFYTEKDTCRFLYITSKNIRNNYMDLTKIQYVDSDFHETIYPRCKPELGDVLLTKDGANTGNVTLNTIDEPFSLLSSVCLIKPNLGFLNPSFLKYYIQSRPGFEQITGKMTGAAIKRIVLKTIKAATMPMPEVGEQVRLVESFDALLEESQRLETIYQQKLTALAELKQSILQKAFAGELTSQPDKAIEEAVA